MLSYLLRPFERFFHTDVKYLAEGSFWLTTGRVVSAGISFILSLLYARYLIPEAYGAYRYVLSMIGAFGIFALPGVGTVMIRSVARGYDGSYRKGAFLIFFSSFGISIAAWCAAAWFFIRGDNALALAFIAGGFFVPFAEGLGHWRAYFEGKKLFREKTFYNIVASFFYGIIMASAIGFIAYMEMSFLWAAAILVGSYFLGQAIPNSIAFVSTLRRLPSIQPEERGSLQYGFHLSLLKIPSTLANYLDGILLYMFLGPAALAVYSFAIALPEQIKSIFAVTASVAFPKLSLKSMTGEERLQLHETLPGKILRSILVTGVVVVAYIVVAPFLYRIFFPAYIDSIVFSQVFALSLILFPLAIFGSAIQAEGNLRDVYLYEISTPLFQIVLLAILITLFGIWGAVIGRVVGRLAGHMIAMFLYMRRRAAV